MEFTESGLMVRVIEQDIYRGIVVLDPVVGV